MRFCRRCVLPDTRPNLAVGSDGVCSACKTHETKDSIDWVERERLFAEVAARAKAGVSGYDCVIPVSGGKDSTWQVVKCLEYGLSPLAVTWKTPGRTEIGRQNLENLVSLGVDHIDYQVNPDVERRFMRVAFERYGSTAIPMHMAIFNIPAKVAVRFRIPLVVWGENSEFEYGGIGGQPAGFRLDDAWLERYGATHGTTATDWLSDGLTDKDLAAYFGPTSLEMEEAGTNGVFLGHYFRWDPVATAEIAEANGFSRNLAGPRTGIYDHADIDDTFVSVHHWMKWYKFGFTRSFDNLSLEIRNGRLSRDQAIQILCGLGEQRPDSDFEEVTRFVGWTVPEFLNLCEKSRNQKIWKYRDGQWWSPEFPISEWCWSQSSRQQ